MQVGRSTRWAAALTTLLAALALGACGDNEDSGSSDSSGEAGTTEQAPASSGSGTTMLNLDAVEKGPQQFAFSKTNLAAKAGTVTVTMRNPSGNQAPHAIEVEGNGLEEAGEVVQAGGTSKVTVDLKPGKYEFYCPVGNHKDLGMEGTLTVR